MIGFLIAILIFGWGFYGLHVMGLNQAVLKDLSEPIAKWFDEPGNNIRAGVALVSFLVAVIALASDSDSCIGQFKGDMLSIAITVVVLDELSSYRSRLERKQEILEQIESPVRDVAVEAIRLARKLGFLDEALRRVVLSRLNLEEADLQGANLQGIHINQVNLKKANLTNSNCEGAIMIGVDLSNAYLRNVNLRRVHSGQLVLQGANLKNADLRNASLNGANLQKANLFFADMRDAYLGYADLRETNLLFAVFAGATYNEYTKWPEGFDPQSAGAILVESPSEKTTKILLCS